MSNESLVNLIKKLSNDMKNLEREIPTWKRGVKSAQGIPPSVITVKNKDFISLNIVLNLLKKSTSASLVGEALCDSGGREA